MPNSTIGPARRALFDLLDAAITAPTDVTYGLPVPAEAEAQEVVAMLGLEGPSEDAASLGSGNRREEVFDIIVGVKVYDPAGTGRGVDERAMVLVDTVRNTVLANRTLTQTIMWAEPAAVRSDGPLPLQQGWIMLVEIPVRCRARI